MNTHIDPSKSHTSPEEDPHKYDQQDGRPSGVHIGGHGEEHHGEKPSMMKRVRAKARKIRDSIKEHVGHGHDHDHDEVVDDDDDDDEMDRDSEKHATHTSQSIMPGNEGVARQHEPKLEGRTTAEGSPVASKPGDYQTYDPTTTKYTPGQDETTLGWSRTDAGRPKESEEQPYAPKSTPAVATHLGGRHSTGDSEIGKEGGHVKLGGRTGGSLGGVEEISQAPKGGWGHHSPANYQAKVADPTSFAEHAVMPEGHGSKLGERTAMEGSTNVPMNNPQGDHRTLFDTNPASYVHGQEADLREEEASNASMDTPFAAHSGYASTVAQSFVPGQHKNNLGEKTAMEGVIHEPTSKPEGRHVSEHEDNLSWSSTDTEMLKGSEEMSNNPKYTPLTAQIGGIHGMGDEERNVGKLGGVLGNPAHLENHPHALRNSGETRNAENNLGGKTAMEGVIHEPTSKPEGRHVSEHEDNLSWSSTDTEMLKGSEEMSNNPKYTPLTAHIGGTHGMGDEERNVGKLGGVLGNPAHLENHPHALRDSGETRNTENYESKNTDPIGKGGEEIGVTPVLNQLDRMNIHGEPRQKQNITSNQEESMFEPEYNPRDKKLSSGSHDQFFPKPVTSETPISGSHGLGDEGWHNKSEQRQESHVGLASSAGAMMADKAKQATSSVTPKQGYGGSSDKQSSAVQGLHQKHSAPGGNAEKISIATAVVADKAVQAKDVVATKLGYGGSSDQQSSAVQGLYEKHSEPGGNAEKISIATAVVADKTVQAKDAVTMKLGYGGTHEAGPTTMPTDTSDGADKGVSMKEYLVDKLKPGEDDKALSEVITEALPLHKRKEDVSKTREEEEGKKVLTKGRVTDSEEVATRLGRSEDTSYDEAGKGLSGPGKGVMERIMDAATSWYHKNDAEDIKEGKEGSSDIMTSEDDGADGQYKEPKVR